MNFWRKIKLSKVQLGSGQLWRNRKVINIMESILFYDKVEKCLSVYMGRPGHGRSDIDICTSWLY